MTPRSLAAVLAVSFLLCGIAVAESAAHGFGISDSLEITRVLGRPQLLPDGSAVAYVAGDWQEAGAIRAHKPLGRLRVWSASDGSTATLGRSASDPAWSRSGKGIAFFEGLGAARELVVAPFPPDRRALQRFSIVGERSRYSARHFAPLWSGTDQYIVVAEARLHDHELPTTEPYTLSSQTERLPYDAHFRDDTLWRLLRIDPVTQERTVISPNLALRGILPSPDGQKLALTVARHDLPGRFVGDEYRQPVEYFILSIGTDSGLVPIRAEGIESLLGWRDDGVLLARSSKGVVTIDSDSPDAATVTGSPFPDSARHFALAGHQLAAWGPAADPQRAAYVIPPPAPDELRVGNMASGAVQHVFAVEDQQEILQAFWLQAGEQLIVHSRHLESLTEQILLWTANGTEKLLERRWALGPIAAAAGRLVFPAESGDQPPELYTFDLHNRRVEQISKHNRRFASQNFVTPSLVAGGAGGDRHWRGLLYLPQPHGRQETTPLVVRAYGRQTNQAHRFNAEAQMHTARGYAYFLPDVFPRRGALHAAYAEVVPAAVAKLRSDFSLGGQTGFLGGSLGGYAGLVLLTRTRIVDAAVLRAPPAEFVTSWATGKDRDADLLEYLMLNRRPDQDPRGYHEDSPLWLADRITAPTLFLHGSEDAQVPLAQSQWMFQSLRRLGKAPTALRVYPGADHSIVRGSRAFYTDFYEHIFDWWGRYLDPAGNLETP